MTSGSVPTSERPTVRISGPADLARMAPYLIGFKPKQSLVIVGLAGKSIVVTVRVDLADLVEDAPAGLLSGTVAAMVRGGARALVAVVFDDRAEPDADPHAPLPWHGLAEAVASEANLAGVVLDDMLLVSRGCWWSFSCGDPDCCPDGTPLDDESSTVDAAAAYAGLVALPDRAALAALLEPDPPAVRDPLLPRLADAATEMSAAIKAVQAADRKRRVRALKRDLFTAARRADQPGTGIALADEKLVRYGAALSTTMIRNAVWLAVDDERIDGRELWRYLGRRLPGPYAAAPMFLFGWASWRAGNGAFARIAADHALAADPAFSPADLLLAALSHGFDPRQVPKLRPRRL